MREKQRRNGESLREFQLIKELPSGSSKHKRGGLDSGKIKKKTQRKNQRSQVEIGSNAMFVGVYDGHGGPEASRFINDHLFLHLMRIAREHGSISEDILRSFVSATGDGSLTLVRRSYGIKP